MTGSSDLFRSEYRQALEEELRDCFAGREGLLYNMLHYQLGWKDEQGTPLSGLAGEHLYSFLCLLSCESMLGEYAPALPAAAAVELVHNFSLIHEEVQAGSLNQGRRATVWWIWGPGQAINAGDGMHAMARLALMRLEGRGFSVDKSLEAIRLWDQSCLGMCEGQHLDLSFQEKLDVGVDAYFRMAAGKSGALMSCAMGLGALAATEEPGVVEAFKECGKNLGVAYQILDDISDLWGANGGEAPSNNVLNKKKLLPVVYALQTGDLTTKRSLGSIYFKRILEPPDVQELVSILDNCSAQEYAEETVENYCRLAMESLEGVPVSPWGRAELAKVGQYKPRHDR